MDSLIELWQPGVKISRTYNFEFGRLVLCALIAIFRVQGRPQDMCRFLTNIFAMYVTAHFQMTASCYRCRKKGQAIPKPQDSVVRTLATTTLFRHFTVYRRRLDAQLIPWTHQSTLLWCSWHRVSETARGSCCCREYFICSCGLQVVWKRVFGEAESVMYEWTWACFVFHSATSHLSPSCAFSPSPSMDVSDLDHSGTPISSFRRVQVVWYHSGMLVLNLWRVRVVWDHSGMPISSFRCVQVVWVPLARTQVQIWGGYGPNRSKFR
jgi:hypothetical protein